MKKRWISDLITREKIIQQWENTRAITIKAPPGSGKSHFIKNTLYQIAKSRNQKILLLVHRINCRQQFMEEIIRDKKIETIHIKTYQSLQKNEFDFKEYTYIVCDEFHYFTGDAIFNYKTDVALNKILDENGKIKIFMSATGDLMTAYLKNIKKIDTLDYEIPQDFNWIKTLYFYNKDSTLIDICRECIENNKKMMIFMDSAEKAYELYKLYKDNAVFNCSKSNKLYKYVNTEAINKVLENEKFESNLFITTTCMDTGVNIKDSNLEHMTVDIKDIDQLIQCLGRKRRNEDETVHIYLKNQNNNVLGGLKKRLLIGFEMAKDYKEKGLNYYIDKYSRSDDSHVQKYYNNLLYDVMTSQEKILNELMYYKISTDLYNIDRIIGRKGVYKPIYYKGFIAEKLSFPIDKIIEIEGKREGETLKDYLESNVGHIYLSLADRKPIIDAINVRCDGKQLKKINNLNGALEERKLPYRIVELNKITEVINGKTKQFKTPWRVEKLTI